MGCAERARRLIVNADDFGASPSINRAVIQAHQQGILTTASLMVAGSAFEQAVDLARQNPRLGVGLHLTLVCGDAVLQPREIPGLVDGKGRFSADAVGAGLKYFFHRTLAPELKLEIRAQLGRFSATGLVLDHINGHLNLHLHPTVLRILLEEAGQWNIRSIRLTREPLGLNLRIARGRLGYRLSHWLIFEFLSWRLKTRLRRQNIRYTRHVFGLLQNGHVDERYVVELLARLPGGDSELYSHPCLDKFKFEMDALLSPAVRRLVSQSGIELLRYQDL